MDRPTEIWKADRSCPICLEEFEDGVVAVLLHCGHALHDTCHFNLGLRSVADSDGGERCPECRVVGYVAQEVVAKKYQTGKTKEDAIVVD